MNLNTDIYDDWGWYIDIEKNYNNYINFIIIEQEPYNNVKSNKKMSYHLNRLETIDEYDYYYDDKIEYNEDEYNKKYNEKYNEKIDNNEVKNIEKGLFVIGLTTIITTIVTYFTRLIFKVIH